MAVCLLKSVDSLDPDKMNTFVPKPENNYFGIQQNSMPALNPLAMGVPANTPEMELLRQRNASKILDLYNRGTYSNTPYIDITKIGAEQMPLYYNPMGYSLHMMPTQQQQQTQQQSIQGNPVNPGNVPSQPAAPPMAQPVVVVPQTKPAADGLDSPPPRMNNNNNDPSKKTQNFTGEVFFDDLQEEKRPKRRRRRTVYSSRRNLQCLMCGVTETPEWRRGPAGDHTLCNACGLHYAKSLKKQRKEREARKHSVDMLLNKTNQPDEATAL